MSRILADMGTHGHVVAALLQEMKDVKGPACFENCETEFLYSQRMRQGSEEAPVLSEKWSNMSCGSPRGSRRPRVGWVCSVEKEMMQIQWWADMRIFCDDQEKLTRMVNFIDELMDLDMEPKPESMWWTSTYTAEDGLTLKAGSGGKGREIPFGEVLDVLGYRFRRTG